MKPITKEATDEIRYILEGCRSGRLRHDQSTYHCGTSHCIAGWKTVLDKAVPMRHYKDGRISVLDLDYEDDIKAKEAWGLTERETDLLFHGDSTFQIQFAVLECLEEDIRIEGRYIDVEDLAEDIKAGRKHDRLTKSSGKNYPILYEKILAYEYPKQCDLVDEFLTPSAECEINLPQELKIENLVVSKTA